MPKHFNRPWSGKSHIFTPRMCVVCGDRGDKPGSTLGISSCWSRCMDCWGKAPDPELLEKMSRVHMKAAEIWCMLDQELSFEGTEGFLTRLATLAETNPEVARLMSDFDSHIAILSTYKPRMSTGKPPSHGEQLSLPWLQRSLWYRGCT